MQRLLDLLHCLEDTMCQHRDELIALLELLDLGEGDDE